MHKAIWGACVVLGLTVICLWPRATRRIDEPAKRIRLEQPADIELLRTRVLALETDLRLLSARCDRVVVAQSALVSPAPAPTATATALEQPSAADALQEDQARSVQLAERFDALVRNEAIDRSQSERLTRDLAAQLASHSPDTRLSSVECVASQCKLVMEHRTRGAQRAIDEGLEDWAPRKSGIAYDYDDSVEPPLTIAYLARTR